MAYSIRAFQSGDESPVAGILHELWGRDPEMLHIYDHHKDWQDPPTSLIRRTLVAESDASVVGMGTIFESTYSPHVLFLSIHVAPAFQRRGIGGSLFDRLVALGDSRPHTVKMKRTDGAGMSFLEKRGFSVAVDSLTGVIDLASEEAHRWIATLPSEANGLNIVSLGDPTCAATPLDLAWAQYHVYAQYHEWSPPAVPGDERVLQWFVGDAIEGTNLCAFRNGELVGGGNLIATPFNPANGAEAYMVWVGVLESASCDTPQATGALIRRLLEKAARLGLRVRFESDSTYRPHRKILETAPILERSNDFCAMMDGKVAVPV